MEIGKRIRHFREKLKLTQERLGELAGIDSNNISRIERGETMPNIETLLKLCNELKVTPNDILLFEYNAPIYELSSEIARLLADCPVGLYPKIIEYITFVKQHSR